MSNKIISKCCTVIPLQNSYPKEMSKIFPKRGMEKKRQKSEGKTIELQNVFHITYTDVKLCQSSLMSKSCPSSLPQEFKITKDIYYKYYCYLLSAYTFLGSVHPCQTWFVHNRYQISVAIVTSCFLVYFCNFFSFLQGRQ